MHALFTIYSTGTTRSVIAAVLNDRGHRTTRGALFCADTVRDMLGNLSYAGFVTYRTTLKRRRQRLRDLYEMGDLERAEYVAKREAIDAKLDSLSPGVAPDIDSARIVLEDFGRFWEEERDPEKRRELVAQLVERVWIDDKRVVAICPTPAFKPFFACNVQENKKPPASWKAGGRKRRERRDSNRGFTHRGIEVRVG